MSDTANQPRILADVGAIWRGLFREFDAEAESEDEAVLVALTKAFARAVVRGTMPSLPAERSDVRGVRYPEALLDMIAISQDAMERLDDEDGAATIRLLTPLQAPALLVLDWIRVLRLNDPKAYAKLPRMNYDAMWQAQDRWHAKLAKKKNEAAAGDLASCQVLHRYPDGWAWAWVRTDAERDAEGDSMGHCVGQGGYDRLGSTAAIVSLRDPAGRPHVTLQIEGIRRIQAQGRGNSRPAEKYNSSIADATGRIGAAVSRYRGPRWLDEAEANEILSEEIARSVRKTGHPHRVRIEVPDTELRRIGRAARIARDVVAAHGA